MNFIYIGFLELFIPKRIINNQWTEVKIQDLYYLYLDFHINILNGGGAVAIQKWWFVWESGCIKWYGAFSVRVRYWIVELNN